MNLENSGKGACSLPDSLMCWEGGMRKQEERKVTRLSMMKSEVVGVPNNLRNWLSAHVTEMLD